MIQDTAIVYNIAVVRKKKLIKRVDKRDALEIDVIIIIFIIIIIIIIIIIPYPNKYVSKNQSYQKRSTAFW